MKVRCIDADWAHGRLVVGKTYDADEGGMVCHLGTRWMAERFEPVTDEPDKDLLNLAFPCPGIDPDDRRYAAEDDSGTAALMELHDRASGATARLHAGLESEKVRERVKAFPHPARNPR